VADADARPTDFFRTDFNDKGWGTMPVPGIWELNGYGDPMYTNIRYPWENQYDNNPPYVPVKDNHVGSYRRDFEVPVGWGGDRVFLKFDGVDSFYYLWVNGKYVGFTKDSRCAAEYDVTDFVKTGKNTVALEVYRYSDGAYLEDQDMFRLSGIFRSAWLVRRPQVRIRDFFARAKPAAEGAYGGNWDLLVECDVVDAARAANAPCQIAVSLYDMDGKKVPLKNGGERREKSGANSTAFNFRLSTSSTPRLWSCETPNCYKLVLTLVQGKKTLESVSTLFGFRESKISDTITSLLQTPRRLRYSSCLHLGLRDCIYHGFYPHLSEINHFCFFSVYFF